MSAQHFFKLLSVLVYTFWLTGCTSVENNQKKTSENRLLEFRETLASQTDNRDYSLFTPRSHTVNLNDYVQEMIIDFQLNSLFNKPIAITSFVEFDKTLTKTNQLGNQLAETFLIEMGQAGYSVADINASDEILLNTNGNFAFSRNLQINTHNLCCVLSGNLVYQSNGVRVNAKIFDMQTQRIIAASSLVIPYFVVEHLGQTQIP
jgi:TolB-like protein